MSLGPGHVMRTIAAELAAAPDGDMRPEPLSYREFARRVYGDAQPSRAQREAVARACRRLSHLGRAELWTVRENVPSARWEAARGTGRIARYA
jgi:hypothetical protein